MSESDRGPVPAGPAVLMPRSAEEAVAAFRAGDPPIVVGGGTIVVPDCRAGRSRPGRALLLTAAGLDGVSRAAGVVTVGAAVTLDRLGDLPAPLGAVAAGIADREIRAQATIGGNLCAQPTGTVPRGDLQVPLIALDARVRVVDSGGEQMVPAARFVQEGAQGRLVLSVEIDDVPRIAGTARLGRPHTHSYTAAHVCAVAGPRGGRLADVRVVAGGVDDLPVRLTAAEEALTGRALDDADPAMAAERCADHAPVRTDALASAWYRTAVLPVLVRKACEEMLGRKEDGQ